MIEVMVRPEDNPATVRPDWLPETSFSELEELRQEHISVLADWHAVGDQRRDLERTYAEQDESHAEALQAAYRDGVDSPKLPKRTPQAERERKLAALDVEIATRRDYLWNLIAEIVEAVQRHEREWCEKLLVGEAEAAARVADLRRQLAEAESAAAAAPKLRMWVERTARNQRGLHIGWTTLIEPPADLLTIANRGMHGAPSAALQRELERSASGGQDVDANRVPDYSDDLTIDYSSEEYQRQLDQTLGDWNRRQREGAV